jgi:hypothetical protein
MKLRSAPILGCFVIFFTLADYHFDCKDLGGAGLMDGLWLAAAVTNSNQGDQRLQGEIDGAAANNDALSGRVDTLDQTVNDLQSTQGQPGVPGTNGLACWDLNGNGQPDPEEDVNHDGVWDALDCQGAAGQNGQNGQNGQDGQDGQDLTGVLARGRIDGTLGTVIEATNLTSDLDSPGQYGLYRIVADVSGFGVQRLVDENVQSIDFPVFITVRAYVDDFGGGATTPFLGFYQFEPIIPGNPDPDPSLQIDTAAGTATLHFWVRIIDVRTGDLARPGDFSLLVLEP